MHALHVELALQRAHERAEELDLKAVAGRDEGTRQIGINEGRKDQGAHALAALHGVDLFGGLLGLFDRVDEGDALLVVAQIRELGHYRVRKRLGRDGRAVAYDEDGAPLAVAAGALIAACAGVLG